MQVQLKHTKFTSGPAVLRWERYHNGRPALYLDDPETGEPIMAASVNIEHDLAADEIAIKDYSENEGVLQDLAEAGIVECTGQMYLSGYVKIPIARLLVEPSHCAVAETALTVPPSEGEFLSFLNTIRQTVIRMALIGVIENGFITRVEALNVGSVAMPDGKHVALLIESGQGYKGALAALRNRVLETPELEWLRPWAESGGPAYVFEEKEPMLRCPRCTSYTGGKMCQPCAHEFQCFIELTKRARQALRDVGFINDSVRKPEDVAAAIVDMAHKLQSVSADMDDLREFLDESGILELSYP